MKKQNIEEIMRKQQEEINKLKKKAKRQKWINLFLIWGR